MMAAYLPNRSNPKSLTAQIRDAERQVLSRQRRVDVRAVALVRQIRQQMAAPATLLLAGGIGFMLGELTRRQVPNSPGAADQPRAAGTMPLRTALNLITSAHALYTALPLAWMMKSFSGVHRNVGNVEESPPPEPGSHVRHPGGEGFE